MPCFGQPTMASILEQVESSTLDKLDVSHNACLLVRPIESVVHLCLLLKRNTTVKTLVMRDCELSDPAAEVLADMLTSNHTIEELDLQRNKLTATGAIALACGLAKNRGLRRLNLSSQKVNLVIGEECLERYKTMLDTNITLQKVIWHLEHWKASELTRLFTRNVEIQRRLVSGKGLDDVTPMNKRDADVTPTPRMQSDWSWSTLPGVARRLAAQRHRRLDSVELEDVKPVESVCDGDPVPPSRLGSNVSISVKDEVMKLRRLRREGLGNIVKGTAEDEEGVPDFDLERVSGGHVRCERVVVC